VPTPRELLDANLHDVFNNRDPEARRAVIDRIYHDDIVFTDPEGTTTGRDAIDSRAGGLLDTAPPEFQFVDDSIHYDGGDTAALAWAFGPVGAPVVRGIDILTIRDGRIGGIRTIVVEGAPDEPR